MIPLGTDIEKIGKERHWAVLAALRKSQEFKRYAVMKKVLLTAIALLVISFSATAKEVIELPGKVEPVAQGDDFALLQSTEIDEYGMPKCYGYICGRWGCYKYEVECEY